MKNEQLDSFESLATEFARDIRNGLEPKIESYAERNAALASRIRRLFPVLKMMELKGDSRPSWSEDELTTLESSSGFSLPFDSLGDYRIIREIGRGGMGVVYEAEQQSLARRVAVKVLPHVGQLNPRKLERFQIEARASANLHHTNIVPVFGVGQENGLSYFVMQFIDGQPLDRLIRENASRISTARRNADTDPMVTAKIPTDRVDYSCVDTPDANTLLREPSPITGFAENDEEIHDAGMAESQLDVNQRLLIDADVSRLEPGYYREVAKIGVGVAEALSYAHGQGILHRDIKPSNLLVNDAGEVWVTDFGLAKRFDSPDITQTGEVLGTLRYMSPEQLDGKATPSSDVFGLGLTLYELLTLKPAYSNDDRKNLLQKVAHAHVPAPRSLNSQIPRDLETIVSKCIEREERQRYDSAEDLAADLNRFLNGQPILARPSSQLERVWKWCKRKPVIAAMTAALFVSIVAGLGGVTWQWRKTVEALSVAEQNFTEAKSETARAEYHFDQAQRMVQEFFELTAFHPALRSANFSEYRQQLTEKALKYFVMLLADYEKTGALEWKVAVANLRLAQLNDMIAREDEALDYLQKCFDVLDKMPADQKDLREKICRAQAYTLKGSILTRTDPTAISYFRDATKIGDELYDSLNLAQKIELNLFESYRKMAMALEGNTAPSAPEFQEVVRCYRRSFELAKDAYLREGPATNQGGFQMADSYFDMAMLERRLSMDVEKIRGYFDMSLDVLSQINDDDTQEVSAIRRGQMLNSYACFEGFRPRADLEKAIGLFEEAKQIFSDRVRKYGEIIQYRSEYGRILTNMGRVYLDLGRPDEALACRLEAVEIRKGSAEIFPDRPKIRSELGNSQMSLGIIYDERGDTEKALEQFRAAKENHEHAVKLAPRLRIYRIRLAMTIGNVGQLNERIGEFENAYQQYAMMVGENETDPEPYYLSGRELANLAAMLEGRDSPSKEEKEIAKNAFETSKMKFQFLVNKGLDIGRRLRTDGAFRETQSTRVGTELLEWLKAKRSPLPTPR